MGYLPFMFTGFKVLYIHEYVFKYTLSFILLS